MLRPLRLRLLLAILVVAASLPVTLLTFGLLLRSWRQGGASLPAYLEDHAALILGLLALYQSDPNPRWFIQARQPFMAWPSRQVW